MGHANQIALGIAISRPETLVCCLDGDGAAIMHLGSLAICGQYNLNNYFHVVLNNGVHGSVGGQPTVGLNINLSQIAKNCGYQNVISTDSLKDLEDTSISFINCSGAKFMEIKIAPNNMKGIGRPTISPSSNMHELKANLDNNPC